MLRHPIRLCGAILMLLCSSVGFAYGAEIDRLLVAVNGRVITEGDLELARNLNAILFNDRSFATVSREDEIDRLIDLELMRQELKNFSLAQEDEGRIEARMESLREAYADKGGLPLLLRRLGLQESELADYVKLESSIMKFVNFRFRPFAVVSEQEIENYYRTRLTPQLRESRIPLPELQQVSGKIEGILREEKINGLLEQWIKEIRRTSRIEYFESGRGLQAPGTEVEKP